MIVCKWLVLLLCIALSIPRLSAAIDCEARLEEARIHYALGRVQQVVDRLQPCFDDENPTPEIMVLLAKAHLARDHLGMATEILLELMRSMPDYQPAAGDPKRFRVMVEALREKALSEPAVSSVSKARESQRDAPATVVVLERAEILRRGYLDLAAVLHDLPGFEVQVSGGDVYSNFNQRGYRAPNDRTLLLVDGVEANDLWRGPAYLSRQYSLTNIERIEVIYGPASTMYGSHAFVGVINVITREPEKHVEPGRTLGLSVIAGGGEWDTRYADLTLAWKHPFRKFGLTLTSRIYQSDDPDLSNFPNWDYDLQRFDTLDYSHLTTDPQLVEQARAFDKAALSQELNGEPIGYSDLVDDRMIHGRIQIKNLLVGFMSWRRNEGFTSMYTEQIYAGARNGSGWVPQHDSIWLQYSMKTSANMDVELFARFKKHTLTDQSFEKGFIHYANGNLDLDDLRAGIPSYWRSIRYNQSSRQFRVEAKAKWEPSRTFKLISGAEVRQSLLQGNYMIQVDCPLFPDGICPKGNVQDQSGQFFDVLDLGIYAQAAWQFHPNLTLTMGGRGDQNRARLSGATFSLDDNPGVPEPEGYGRVFNPRLALAFRTENLTVKSIYAEAFKDASQWERYATVLGFRDLPNPGLEPEKVRNFEVSAQWDGPNYNTSMAIYRARYSNGVTPQLTPFEDGFTLQNKATGSLDIRGIQMSLDYQWPTTELYVNYNYVNSRGLNFLQPNGSTALVQVADIAPHHINAGISKWFFDQIHVNLRGNWSADKPTGSATTAPTSPLKEVDGYMVFNLGLTYENKRLAGFRPQLLIQNLLDESYVHPGVGSADGTALASTIPQPGRALFLRFSYQY